MSLKKYFFLFANDIIEFRHPEIESILKLFNINLDIPSDSVKSPYWLVESNSEADIRKIASRSVSIKLVAEVWQSGRSYKEFHENLKSHVQFIEPKFKQESFRFVVDTFNKKLNISEKIERIESMGYLPFEGLIDLKNPQHRFLYFEYFGLEPNDAKEEPEEIIMGRFIAEGQRDLIKSISLKTRKFIGNTSMDPTLSMLMANQALCQKNDLMFDPFCGTGSLLISAALFGSYVIGADIDFLMLHGRTRPSRVQQKVREKDENIKMNMIQYNLQHLYLDVFVGDFSNCPLKDSLVFDSIICDPPYGIREAMEKIEKKERRLKFTAMTEDATHYPSFSQYKIKNMYYDLLNYAAKNLKMHGRLVCFFPTPNKYNSNLYPQHSAFKLVNSSKQKLVGDTSRLLLTYEKISEDGEYIDQPQLEKLDFRHKYFTQGNGSRQERRENAHQQNMAEAEKRGLPFHNNREKKKLLNKRRHEDL